MYKNRFFSIKKATSKKNLKFSNFVINISASRNAVNYEEVNMRRVFAQTVSFFCAVKCPLRDCQWVVLGNFRCGGAGGA
jgi:hypothetical protein